MERFQIWLKDTAFGKFAEARFLSLEESKNDPQNEPYKSKYAARKILKELKAEAEEIISVEDLVSSEGTAEARSEEPSALQCEPGLVLAAIEYELGVNYVETEEVSAGQKCFVTCLKYLEGSFHAPCHVTLVISTKCQDGIIWSNRGEHQKAFHCFDEAERMYHHFKKNFGSSPLIYRDILLPPEKRLSEQERTIEFEKQYTLILYYLAQVYKNLGEAEKAARYCHVTLAKQMECGQYEPLDWALNCATLSQYYITKEMYPFARYCLACASKVFMDAELKGRVGSDEEEEDRPRKEERMEKVKADIARCWSKFCLNLLITSHTANLRENHPELQTDELWRTTDTNPTSSNEVEEDMKMLNFGNLEVTLLEEQVTDKVAKDYESAKALFLSGQKWVNESKEFYKFDGYVSDFVEITQDLSQFYKYLAYFENDFERRCKMHKRRIDSLSSILVELNPQHFLQICRQLTFEIAEIYGDMADLKRALIEDDSSRLGVENIKKINKLVLQGVKYYEGFIDSYKRKGKLPDTYEDDALRGVLLAYFYMARLHSKYLTPDRTLKADYLKKEQSLYQYIVNYCDSHPNMPKVFEQELSICRDVVALFPAKMNKILDQ